MDNSPEEMLDALLKDHGDGVKTYNWFTQQNEQEKKIELGLLLKAVISDFRVFPALSLSLCQQLRVLISHFNADPLLDLPIYIEHTMSSGSFITAWRKVHSAPIEEAVKMDSIAVLRVIAELRPEIFENEIILENLIGKSPKNSCCELLVERLEKLALGGLY